MDLWDTIYTRRSIRSFNDKAVNDEQVKSLIRAGMAAPSAGNQQPWHFVIVRNKEKLKQIQAVHPYSKMAVEAPVSILVCGTANVKWDTFWSQDCSAASQNILLAARAMDLGSVWVGIYPEEDRMEGFREAFSIPEEIYPFALIPVGYTDVEFSEKDRFIPDRIMHETWA